MLKKFIKTSCMGLFFAATSLLFLPFVVAEENKNITEDYGPGSTVSDGSIYIGNAPGGTGIMYATRCDFGMQWDGMECTGKIKKLAWQTGDIYKKRLSIEECKDNSPESDPGCSNGKETVKKLLLQSDYETGRTFPAAMACEYLNAHGKSDWYLPSLSELTFLYPHRAALGLNIDLGSAFYWSSSGRPYEEFKISAEEGGGYGINYFAWGFTMATETAMSYRKGTSDKINKRPVRCVRREQ